MTMSKIIEKRFYEWEFEKEEKWLNEMVNEGWILQKIDYNLLKLKAVYTFEQCEPDEYQIRIDIVHTNKMSNRTKEFVNFVKETGAEKIDTYSNFLYFKKKKSLGDFELYSDDSASLTRLRLSKYIYLILFGIDFNFLYRYIVDIIVSGQVAKELGLIILSAIFFYIYLRGFLKNQLAIENIKKRNMHDNSEHLDLLVEKGNLGLGKIDKIYIGVYVILGLLPYLSIAMTYGGYTEGSILGLLMQPLIILMVAGAGILATTAKDHTRVIIDIQFIQPVIACVLCMLDFYIIASILGFTGVVYR